MCAKGKKYGGVLSEGGGMSGGFENCLLMAGRGILAAGRIYFWSCKGFVVRNWRDKIIWENICIGWGFGRIFLVGGQF